MIIVQEPMTEKKMKLEVHPTNQEEEEEEGEEVEVRTNKISR